MVLHRLDDYPIHQTSQGLAHLATDSPNAYDRFFFNGWHPDGDVFFAAALGVYPNRSVMDAAFSVVVDGNQHNVRASRRAPQDRTLTSVPPITVTVIEPMLRHRIEVTADHGVSADLEFRAITPAVEEPRFVRAVDHRVVMDYTRLTQFGRWQGWIDVDGRRIEVDTSHCGVRDRSWGIRSVGDQPVGPQTAPQFFWIWCPTVFDDRCTHLALNHDGQGRPWHQSGAMVPLLQHDGQSAEAAVDQQRIVRADRADVVVAWQAGTRWAAGVTTRAEMWDREPLEVVYEPLVRFQMSGIGYLAGEWRHGIWRGDHDSTRDDMVLADLDPLVPEHLHIQALCRARWGDRVGTGVVEQLVIGPHAPSGFEGILDGA